MSVETTDVGMPAPSAPADRGRRRGPWPILRRAAMSLLGPAPVSIGLALVLGGVVIALAGADPITAYRVMGEGALTGPGLVNTFQRAVPLVGMALALAVAFRAGVFNLGGEGQMVLGGLAGTVVALFVPGPGLLVMLLAFAAAVLAGGLWGALSAVLETRLAVPILISSLLLSYPARYFSSYLVRFPLKEKGSSLVATEPVPEAVRIPSLLSESSPLGAAIARALGPENILVRLTSTLDWSLVVVALLIVAVLVFNRRTPAGFEAGITGLNPHFARYAGVRTDRLKVSTMFVSGGIAGLVGIMLVLGSQIRLVDGALIATNYAWTGLLVALLAGSRPLRVAVAGAFFAAIIVGGEAMQRSAGVSAQISQLIQAIVIVLIAIRVQVTWRRRAKSTVREQSDDLGRV
ncbi:ABC transporter permease [Cellulomonas fimi]|uniref:ABC transporter permease n=1 Tax=Cellulomonas fimi TaxID=1708 RepID=A0A7Y0LVZ8_CELFI|nr:ABC transporter permease [Cellulomonas fimi]NMR19256.1 ABC transporter permease [Cellulomonas fimi]